MQEILVVAALWQREDGCFFVAQRCENQSHAGLWEFPGGKVEADESEKEALKRELFEEINIEVEVKNFVCEAKLEYAPQRSICLRAYEVDYLGGSLELKEHMAMQWCSLEDLEALALTAADIDIVQQLQEIY